MLLEYMMTALAAFFGALISGLGGFGGSFIIVIVMTPVVGAKSVIPLIAVYAICANISRVLIYYKTIAWKPAIQFTLASLPGIYLGASFLKGIPDLVFLAFMGAILISVIPVRRWLKRTSFDPGLKTIISLGLLFGFMSGTAAGSGMLVIAFFNSIGLSGPLLLGTDAVIGLANSITRSGTFFAMNLLTNDLLFLGLFMGMISFPATWVASKIVHRMGTRIHNHFIEFLILASGCFFIVKAIMGFFDL